jgi:hypothetical protein
VGVLGLKCVMNTRSINKLEHWCSGRRQTIASFCVSQSDNTSCYNHQEFHVDYI